MLTVIYGAARRHPHEQTLFLDRDPLATAWISMNLPPRTGFRPSVVMAYSTMSPIRTSGSICKMERRPL